MSAPSAGPTVIVTIVAQTKQSLFIWQPPNYTSLSLTDFAHGPFVVKRNQGLCIKWRDKRHLAGNATRPNHHVDAYNLVALGGSRKLADDRIVVQNVKQPVLASDEEVVVLGHVGVVKCLGAVDGQLAKQPNFGELVQGVVDSSERHWRSSLDRLLEKRLRRGVLVVTTEQEQAERHA